ncbi:MAG: type II toxin-antitoxin system Phd/YefM family antitoxin [Gammaproteobacteria bacterium]
MEICNASDAKREFGELLLKAQKEPVGINKNGKPVAVIVSASEYEELQFSKEQWLKSELQKGFDDLHAGRIKDGQDVMARQKKHIANAAL